VNEQCEVLSAIAGIALSDDGEASLHVHIVLGLSDSSTRGGHLLKGTVHPTLEVVLSETHSALRRRMRPDLGIALIDADPQRRSRSQRMPRAFSSWRFVIFDRPSICRRCASAYSSRRE